MLLGGGDGFLTWDSILRGRKSLVFRRVLLGVLRILCGGGARAGAVVDDVEELRERRHGLDWDAVGPHEEPPRRRLLPDLGGGTGGPLVDPPATGDGLPRDCRADGLVDRGGIGIGGSCRRSLDCLEQVRMSLPRK